MSAGKFQVRQVSTREGFERFARLPFKIYGARQAWWPPDVQNEIDLLSGRALISNHLDLAPFCAMRDSTILARASAVVNHRYNEHWHENIGQLIHFEAMAGEDAAVAALLDQVLEWLARRGMKAVRSGFAAFLDYPYAIDNYNELPSFLLRGNPDYYHRYFKNSGFFTEKGQVDYTAPLTLEILERYRQMVEAAHQAGVIIKSWREFGFLAAIDAWTEITNAAFARHWGWNSISRAEVRPMLSPLGTTTVADLSMIASTGDAAIGAVFSVPDFSDSLASVRAGIKLDPARGGGTRGALVNVGVLEAARSRGVARAMAARSFLTMARNSMSYAGYTLVLDDNWPSRRTAESLGAHVTSNFVSYRREL
ncbi:MAG: hypothetical protein ACREQ4_00970 [Candidatus Binataceae bacterium]